MVLRTSGGAGSGGVGANATKEELAMLAQKVGLNAYNSIMSFAKPLPDGSGSWIEVGVVERWYK